MIMTAIPSGVFTAFEILAILYCAYWLQRRCVYALDKNQQLLVLGLTDTTTINGPGLHFISPFNKGVTMRMGELLGPLDYIVVKNTLTGVRSTVSGPKLHFLQPFDAVERRATAFSLTAWEYLVVKDTRSGEKRVERGPRVFIPEAHEESSHKKTAVSLESNQYAHLRDTACGKRWTVRGPSLLVLEDTWELIGGVQAAFSLAKTEYVRLIDETSGIIRVECGPAMVIPSSTEAVLPEDHGKPLTAINLKIFQYCKLVDNASGAIRVVRGEATVFLGPTESIVGKGRTDAIEIDAETAVSVRSKLTGELTLVSKPQHQGLFFPEADEQIMEVQKLIKLADYECMIVTNGKGEMSFYYGDEGKRGEKPRAFFMPPYHSALSLTWSRGRRREQRDLRIGKIDMRPQFMSFEFNTRTSDNVELVLEGTFFWQIVDVETMVKMTGDTTGDICNHARSKFIQLVSQVTLAEFMDHFNELATKAHTEDDTFFAARGIKIHSLEVTAYRCQDASTARILEQIIQETTNRMNRLSQQESDNEIKMFAMAGEIEQETRRADLLKILQAHKVMEAGFAGEAEAERVRAFLSATEGAVPSLSDRIRLWQTLRKQDALEAVSSGPARLYFTPHDVNLSIETREHEQPLAAVSTPQGSEDSFEAISGN